MPIIIWNKKELHAMDELIRMKEIPMEVYKMVCSAILILEESYDPERNYITDDGGYIYLILPQEVEDALESRDKLLQKYKLNDDEAEYSDEICIEKGMVWYSELYLVSNDYGLIIVYPILKGE